MSIEGTTPVGWVQLGSENGSIKNNEVSYSGYNTFSAKATVKVVGYGCFYFEVKLEGSGACRIGWCTEKHKPESNHYGAGSDEESWAFDGSRKYIYHNAKEDSGTKSYGDYVRQGDTVGCLLDLESNRISYTKNGTDMGVAFNGVRAPPGSGLYPVVSLSRSAKVTANWGRDFQYKPPPRFTGLNYVLKPTEATALEGVYNKYFGLGLNLSESGDTGCIKGNGTLELAKDLGQIDDADPILLILAWKLRADGGVWEFYRTEFLNGWGLWGASDIGTMKKLVASWRAEIEKDKESFRSFHNFIFDYVKPEKATALDKEEALAAWGMIKMQGRWKMWPKWEEFIKTDDRKAVTRDTWQMLVQFIDQNGDSVKNYDPNDCWPTALDDFVDWVNSNRSTLVRKLEKSERTRGSSGTTTTGGHRGALRGIALGTLAILAGLIATLGPV